MHRSRIDEDTTLHSTDTTNIDTTLLGYTCDNISISSNSTNYTESNLAGPGRVLGNVYSSTGNRLVKTLGDIAQRVGFGPEAVYEKICLLGREDWRQDNTKGAATTLLEINNPSCNRLLASIGLSMTAVLLQKLCFKLINHAKYVPYPPTSTYIVLIKFSSVVGLTRFQAIKRWGDILKDNHEIYVWLSCSQQVRLANHANDFLRVIEGFRTTNKPLSEFQNSIIRRTSLSLVCHSVGLQFLSLSRGKIYMDKEGFLMDWKDASGFSNEVLEKWDVLFKHLIDSLMCVA